MTFSKSGRFIFYRDRELKRLKGQGISGNYIDVQTGEEFWISGVKRRGSNRHWAGSGAVQVDDDVKADYQALIARRARARGLPMARFVQLRPFMLLPNQADGWQVCCENRS